MAANRPQRDAYHWFCAMPTRWMDNDSYGHVNNVTYYSYFDTAANRYLIEVGGLDIENGDVIGLVVESQCHYHAAVAFPQQLTAGLRVDKLGNRAVTYGIAIFADDMPEAVAHGHFVHVFVARHSRRPAAIPDSMRAALAAVEDNSNSSE